jgi:hypothetical protein
MTIPGYVALGACALAIYWLVHDWRRLRCQPQK